MDAPLETYTLTEGQSRVWIGPRINDGNTIHILPSSFEVDGKKHSINDIPYLQGNDLVWYKEGKAHRDNDLPSMLLGEGVQMWYCEGELHRENDLPAIIFQNGDRVWYKEGELHRHGLPAFIDVDGSIEYWYEGEQVTKEFFSLGSTVKAALPRKG